MKKLIQLLFTLLLCYQVTAQNKVLIDENGSSNIAKMVAGTNYVPGEVIIKFKNGTLSPSFLESSNVKSNASSIKALSKSITPTPSNSFFNKYGNRNLRKVVRRHYSSNNILRSAKATNKLADLYNLMVLEVDKTDNVIQMCEEISQYVEVEYAEPNYILYEDNNVPNDLRWVDQENFDQPNDIDIDMLHAWGFTTGNEGIKVGIIDTGVDYDHPDLGNAFNVPGAKVRGGYDYINNDNDPDEITVEDDIHGTPIAGIIGGLRNNGLFTAGMAGGDGAGNIGVQLFSLQTSNGQGHNLDKAIDAIVEGSSPTGYGCHVLNLSWGFFTYSESLRSALALAALNNSVVVASKGNNTSNALHFPSDHEWAIAVGSTNGSGTRRFNSNTGNGIDVAAPGSSILSLEPVENGNLGTFGNTSGAAAFVSGLASLILSEALEQGRSLHYQDVEGIIEASAEDRNAATLPGYDDEMGHGLINAGRALAMMNDPWELTHHSVTGGTSVSTSQGGHSFINLVGGLASANYVVTRHEVRVTVSLPDFLGASFAWGRGPNASTGYSPRSPNYQIGFCEVVSKTNSTVTLRSYVYQVTSLFGQPLGWHPSRPENVVFAYSTLGITCPQNRNVTQTINGTNNQQLIISAENTLTASNFIASPSIVKYSAGNSITLSPGFHVENGAEFTAALDGCERTSGRMIAQTQQTTDPVASLPSLELQTPDAAEESFVMDEEVILYPNPFHESATIAYQLSTDSHVTIQVFNSEGKEVATLVDNDMQSKGRHFAKFGNSNLTPGVYYYYIETAEYSKRGKLLKN